MKTIELIVSLSTREKKEFDKRMQIHKRNSLQRLWLYLKQSKKQVEPDKIQLYQATFKEKYQSAKDYKLRHELRLLNEELMDFLIEKEREREAKANPLKQQLWELKVLNRRNLDTHFEAAFRQILDDTAEARQHGIASQALHIKIERLIQGKEIDEKMYEEIADLLAQQKEMIRLELARRIRYHEVKQAYADRVLRFFQPQRPFQPAQKELTLASKDAYTQFLELEARSFSQSGEAKIQSIEQSLAFLEDAQHPGSNYAHNKMIVLARIALEYFLMHQYQEARQYYEQLLLHAKENKQKLPIEILFNYYSNLIRLQDYHQAIELFNEHEAQIQASPKVTYRFLCLKGMCHIMLKQAGEAMDCVPQELQQRPEPDAYYFRFVLLMAFALKSEWEMALRECRNLNKVVHYPDSPTRDINYPQLLAWFRTFFKAQTELQQKGQNRLQSLQNELTSADRIMQEFLPFIWLRQEIHENLGEYRLN